MSEPTADAFDAAVIGGGPAGSTTAALLARAGLSVCLVEQTKFPRFHIGESLLPAGNSVLRELGLWDELQSGGYLKKWGAEFTYGKGFRRVKVDFSRSLIPGEPHAWQVERARFDSLLLNKAEDLGVAIMPETRVAAISASDGRWQLDTTDATKVSRSLSAKWLIDASGRARILARHLNIAREPVPLPNRVAVFNHFIGIPRRPDKTGNNIIVVRIREGWFWVIPIDEERTSVGLVKVIPKGHGPASEEMFREEVNRSPLMKRLMSNARATADTFHIEADYSYINSRMAGGNYLMVGDAAGFLDPVFSSGVYLALRSAGIAAETLLHAHNAGRPLSPRAQAAYQHALRSRMMSWMRIIQVFYHEKDFSIFMSPSNRFGMFDAVNAVVAGYPPQTLALRWRFALFLLACRLNRHFQIAPKIEL